MGTNQAKNRTRQPHPNPRLPKRLPKRNPRPHPHRPAAPLPHRLHPPAPQPRHDVLRHLLHNVPPRDGLSALPPAARADGHSRNRRLGQR
jgi:hypothetical protein